MGRLFIGEDPVHPGQIPGPRDIQAFHLAVGDGAPEVFGHPRARYIKIIGVARLAAYLGRAVDPRFCLPYRHISLPAR